jgi:hypothetical protein
MHGSTPNNYSFICSGEDILPPSRFLLAGSVAFALLYIVPSADARQLRHQMPARQAGDMFAPISSSGIVPIKLKTEDSINPLGIDTRSP